MFTGRGGLHVRQIVKFAINYRNQRRSIARGYVYDVIGRFTPYLGVSKNGMSLVVGKSDRFLGRIVYAEESFDLDFMDAAIKLVRERCGEAVQSKVFLDIGANIGTSAVAALTRFGASRVIAIEPGKENVRLLRANLALNGLHDRADVYEVALSNFSGSGKLGLSPTNSGDHRLLATAERETVDINVCRILDLELDFGEIGLIWMDVQGHEGHVLQNAPTAVDHIPIVMEFWWDVLVECNGLDLVIDVMRTRPGIIDIRSAMSSGKATVTKPGDVVSFVEGLRHKTTDLLLLPVDYPESVRGEV